jgi:hypothetical protein
MSTSILYKLVKAAKCTSLTRLKASTDLRERRKLFNAWQSDWPTYLPHLQFAYNTRVHATTQVAPLHALLGYAPRSIPASVLHDTPAPALKLITNDDVKQFHTRMRLIHTCVADSIANVQMLMASRHDSQHASSHTLTINVGDFVLLRTSATPSMALPHTASKLNHYWLGPFKVISKPTSRTVKLSLPASLEIHPVVDCSKVRRFISSNDAKMKNKFRDDRLAVFLSE